MGSFGKVFMVKCQVDYKIYAMKILLKDHLTMKCQIRNSWSEQNLLKQFRNKPFMPQLKQSFQSESKLFLVTDYYDNGELFQHLRKLKRFDTQAIRFFTSEVIVGLSLLHHEHIVQRDLKPENIMLDSNGHVVIVDFGLTKILRPEDTQLTGEFVGTAEQLPPEVIQRNKYSFWFDVWNLGCFTQELMTGEPPFTHKNKDLLQRKILNCEPDQDESKYDPDAIALCKTIMVKEPIDRPTISQIKSHSFQKDVDWDQVADQKLECPIFYQLKNKFDIKKIHDQYQNKKNSRKTDQQQDQATGDVKMKLRLSRLEQKDQYFDQRE